MSIEVTREPTPGSAPVLSLKDDQSVKTTRPMWLLLTALVLAEVTSAFEVTMIYACLPTLHRTFDNPIGVGWAITSCLLVSSVAAALCGRLGDLMGRRRVLIVVLILCAVGSMTSALSGGLTGIVIGTSIRGYPERFAAVFRACTRIIAG